VGVKRLLGVLAVLVVGCQPVGDPVEILTHCGLGYPVIDYQGRQWEFEGVGADPNPPAGWGNPFDVIYITRVEGQRAIAVGPDGRKWSLVETDQVPRGGCM
jgi:hypothetical protein